MADRLTEEQIAVFKEAFSHCDKDGDGIITAKEFSSLVGQMLVELRRQPTAKIQNALNQLEADGNFAVDLGTFPGLTANSQEYTSDTLVGQRKLVGQPAPDNPEELTPQPARAGKPLAYSQGFVPMDDEGDAHM